MNKKLAISIATILTSVVSTTSCADKNDSKPFNFEPIESSANTDNWKKSAPWKIPNNYQQSIISNESNLNIYDNGRNDWPDMNTVNETGRAMGRFMYRSHEIRLPNSLPEGGTISVIDLDTGKTKLLAQSDDWNALDGIHWTPWGSILFAEETTGGRLFELKLNADMISVASITDRTAAGRLAHEGIEMDTDGNIYMVDEHRGRTIGCNIAGEETIPCGGGVYKFAPDNYGDLSTGKLYTLKVTGADGTGKAEWTGPVNAENARISGHKNGGYSYQRPEDLEIINNVLYAAITEGPQDSAGKEQYEGRVISINLTTMQVSNFVKAGLNVPIEIGKPGNEKFQTGFDGVDNLAESPDGYLVMIEDNKPSDIWFANTKTLNKSGASNDVKLFASLADPSAEGTGIYFSPKDPATLYVNVQHSAAEDGDGTWAIKKRNDSLVK